MTDLKAAAQEIGYQAAARGKPVVALKFLGWVLLHLRGTTEAQLRARVNAARAELGLPPR